MATCFPYILLVDRDKNFMTRCCRVRNLIIIRKGETIMKDLTINLDEYETVIVRLANGAEILLWKQDKDRKTDPDQYSCLIQDDVGELEKDQWSKFIYFPD